jgi:hypothetical protein
MVKGAYVCAPAPPRRSNLKRNEDVVAVGRALGDVGLDLDPDRRGPGLCVCVEPHRGRVGVLAGEGAAVLTQANPLGDRAQPVEDLAEYRALVGAYEVEILGIALRLLEVKLVQAGAATEGELLGEQRIIGDLYE